MNLKQTPEQWKIANPSKKKAIRRILSDVFDGEVPRDDLDEELLYFIWSSCACAFTYKKDKDPFHLKRLRQTQEHSKKRANAKAAVAKLRASLNLIPDLAPVAILHAIRALPERGIRLSIDEPQEGAQLLSVIFDSLLEELYQGLSEPVLGKGHGPFLHRTQHGCLDYPESIERNSRPAEADTMLLFSVVLHFRRHSLGECRPGEGEPMPESGSSRYKLAAAIVQEVFSDSRILDEKSAEGRLTQLLSRNPGLALMSWPHDHP